MAIDYAKLEKDVGQAVTAARALAARMSDAAPCVSDGVALHLPHAKAVKIAEIAERYGISMQKKGGLILLAPPCGGQGRLRQAQAELLYKILHMSGWTAYLRQDLA